MIDKNSMKKKKFLISIVVILVCLLLIGGTYAALMITVGIATNNGNYNVTTQCMNVLFDNGEDITGVLFPSSSAVGGIGHDKPVAISMDPACNLDVVGNFYINVGEVSETLISQVPAHCEKAKTLEFLSYYEDANTCTSNNGVWVTDGTALKYLLYTTSVTEPLSVGYVKSSGSVNIYADFEIPTTPTEYNVLIWLDGNLSDNSYANLSFDATISASATQIKGKDVLPSVSVDSTNDLTDSQIVTLNVSDDESVQAYYIGTDNPEVEEVDWIAVESSESEEVDYVITEPGVYYFAAKDNDGNVSVINKEFYQINFVVEGGSVASDEVIVMGGKSVALPTPIYDMSTYSFEGWYTNSEFTGSPITSYLPSSNETLYARLVASVVRINYPTALEYCNTLTYTGESQTLTKNAPAGLSFSNNTGTNAGEYIITANLSEGYAWTDGSEGPVTFTCNIAKANLSSCGAVSISGDMQYSQTLTSTVTPPSEISSNVSYTYSWYSNSSSSTDGGTATPSTSSTYTPYSESFGKYVYLVVTMNDTNGNYNSCTASGITSSTIGKRPVTVSSGTSSKVYDGTALTNNTCSITDGGISSTIHQISCTTSGTITNVGTTNNTISSAKVVTQSSGTDVSMYYDISTVEGTLTVSCKEMTGGSASISGTLTYGYTQTINVTAPTDPSTAPSYAYQWYTNTSASNSGGTALSGATSSTYQAEWNSFDKYIYATVTMTANNYCSKTVTSAVSSSTIGKRAITVTAGSSSRVYNGQALTNSTCSVTSGSLAFSHTVSCTNSGTITNPGSVTNTLSKVIVYNNDKSSDISEYYYTVTKKNGTLTVTDPAPTISSIAISKSGSAITGTISASDQGTGVKTYYYILSTSSTAPSSGYSSATTNSKTLYATAAGTYYICGYVADGSGNTSSKKCSSSVTLASSTAAISTISVETRRVRSTTDSAIYQSEWAISSSSMNAKVGKVDSTTWHAARFKYTVPQACTNITLTYYTGKDCTAQALYYRTLATANGSDNYYNQYPSSSYWTAYQGTWTPSGTAYAKNTTTILPPAGTSAQTANTSYYMYVWGGVSATQYIRFYNGGSYPFTMTCNYLG